eukprot:670165-Alexandrium_andersonii.AAC.1
MLEEHGRVLEVQPSERAAPGCRRPTLGGAPRPVRRPAQGPGQRERGARGRARERAPGSPSADPGGGGSSSGVAPRGSL